MKAVIIAGGQGTRLRPITYEIPKPLIPVQGKSVIEYSIDNYLAYGCDQIIVVISEDHRKHFEKWRKNYAQEAGIPEEKIVLVLEARPAGTFGAIALARDYLSEEKTFFAGNADELKDLNLSELENAHAANQGLATIPLIEVDYERAKSLGVVKMGENNQVIRYIEKPEDPPSTLVNMGGPYVMDIGVFDYYDPSREMSSIERDLWEILPSKGLLYGYIHHGQYFGTDTIERWERAIKEYVHKPFVY